MKFACIFAIVLSILVAGSGIGHPRRATQHSQITFEISVPLEFKGRTVSGSLRQSQIPELLDLPIRNGNTDPSSEYGVEMTTPDDKKVMIYTCAAWKKAHDEKWYAATTYDMAMESSFIHTCVLLFELQKAKLPLKSFISNPHVSLADLNLLPAEILTTVPEGNPGTLAGMVVSQLVSPEDIKEKSSNEFRVSYGGFEQVFWEAARADFNGDGIEDILVMTGGRAEEGTMGYSDYLVLTRTSTSGPLKLIQTSEP